MAKLAPNLAEADGILSQIVVELGKGRQVKGGGINKDDVIAHVTPVFTRIWENCLRDHYWAFAEDSAILEEEKSKRPIFGFNAYYILPSDFVSVSYVNGNNTYLEGWRRGWSVLGDYMAANFKPHLSYTKRITDISKFPSHFEEYLILSLAKSICISVTGDKELFEILAERVRMAKHDTINIDFREIGDNLTVEQGTIAAARQMGHDSLPPAPAFSPAGSNQIVNADGSVITVVGAGDPLKDMNGDPKGVS